MTEPKRHNWPLIIRKIKAGYGLRHKKKLTNYKLGLMVAGTDQRTVRGWQEGTEPGHYQGSLLLLYLAEYDPEFHSKVMENSIMTNGQPAITSS